MSRVAYHVTSLKKLRKYLSTGYIKPPVRAWIDIESAERFSKQTGRRIILRLTMDNTQPLNGHSERAIYTNTYISMPEGIL